MTFIEVKATDAVTGETFPSKAAMKRAIAADPRKVRLVSVAMGPQFHGTAADFLAANFNAKLTVVGPDPFTSRKWYGTIEVKNGKLKAS